MLSKVSTFLGPNGLFQGGGGTPSLVLSLDAAGYTGSGTWSDITNFDNDATSDGPIFWSSEGGGSFDFDGTSSYFGFGTVSGIPLGESKYSIEAWFKSDSYEPGEQGSIVGWGSDNNPGYSNVLRLNGNGLFHYWWNDDIGISFSGTSSLYVDNWYYVVATYDGTNRRLYLNGDLVAMDTPGTHLVDDMTTLKIGFFYTDYFNGKISKVKVHSKALSQSKILSNFNADKVRHGYVYGSMLFDEDTTGWLSDVSSDYSYGTGDFTIESFFKISQSNRIVEENIFDGKSGLISQLTPTINDLGVGIWINGVTTSTPSIVLQANGTYSSYTASNDTWYHAAISRTSGTSSFYVNGNIVGQISDNYNYINNGLSIGSLDTSSHNGRFNGLISNVRITKGAGLYSGETITIPQTPLEASANTKLLIISQKTSPVLDVSGNGQTIGNFDLYNDPIVNPGWTSSLPEFIVSQGLEFFVDATDLVSNPSNSSSNWIDISGNGRNLTFSGPSFYPLCTPGCANGLLFSSNQTAQTNTLTISYPTGYTIESVVCFSYLSNGDGIFEFDDPSNGKYINVQRESNGTIRFEVNQGNQLLSASTTTNNLWYHITCVYNSSTQLAKIYINGIEDASGTYTSTTSTTAPIILGLHDLYLDGNISLTRFYSIPLTPSQVLINFNYTKSVYGL